MPTAFYIDTVRYIYNQEELISGPEDGQARRDRSGYHQLRHSGQLAGRRHHQGHGFHGSAPETGKSYFYIFNFLPYRHEFTNWTVTGVDAQYEPDNWAKAINSTNFPQGFPVCHQSVCDAGRHRAGRLR